MRQWPAIPVTVAAATALSETQSRAEGEVFNGSVCLAPVNNNSANSDVPLRTELGDDTSDMCCSAGQAFSTSLCVGQLLTPAHSPFFHTLSLVLIEQGDTSDPG